MTKRDPAREADESTVEAVARFKRNGEFVNVGDLLRMSVAEAADLVAVGFAKPTDQPDLRARNQDRSMYARRDMRAKL